MYLLNRDAKSVKVRFSTLLFIKVDTAIVSV